MIRIVNIKNDWLINYLFISNKPKKKDLKCLVEKNESIKKIYF